MISEPKRARKPSARKTTAQKDHLSIKVDFKPKTEPQRQMVRSFIDGLNLVAHGSAGSGKSFVGCYLALSSFFRGDHEKIVIVRSAVATRDQGFLPGTLEEKSSVFSIPYKNIINELCQCGTAWDVLTKRGVVEFVTTSYIRGITIDNSVVIFDEFQNADAEEIMSLLTRVGENTNIILCGDTKQSDLFRKREKSGATFIMDIAKKMPDWFESIEFESNDIVRSGFVKALIQTVENDA